MEIVLYGFLIVVFGLLQVADGLVTFFGLHFDLVDEVNPVLNCCAELFGLGFSIALLKMAGLAFLTFMFLQRRKISNPWLLTTLVSANAFYIWVVVNNIVLVAGA